jgi:hypothetical protein
MRRPPWKPGAVWGNNACIAVVVMTKAQSSDEACFDTRLLKAEHIYMLLTFQDHATVSAEVDTLIAQINTVDPRFAEDVRENVGTMKEYSHR